MLLIEFMDNPPVVNAASMLALSPDTIALVGTNQHDMRIMQKRLIALAKGKCAVGEMKKTPKVMIEVVNRYDIAGIISLFRRLAAIDDCVCDLVGGDETTLVALGMMADELSISLHMTDVETGRLRAMKNVSRYGATPISPKLTVDENIALYGGLITGRTPISSLSTDDIRDVVALWRICDNDPSAWNRHLTQLRRTLSAAHSEVNELDVMYKNPEKRNTPPKSFLTELYNAQVIDRLYFREDLLRFQFKNSFMREALTKDGLILEIYTSLIARGMTNDDGTPFFSDVQSGVVIDWDGVISHSTIHSREIDYDTSNEIDVLLMRGLVPVFISCKNGQIDTGELYKLNTVALRFGGKYSKRILLSTKAGIQGSMRQRAADMGITLMDRMDDVSICSFDGSRIHDERFEERLRAAVLQNR